MKHSLFTYLLGALLIAVTTGCAQIRDHREFEQPLGIELTTGIGGTMFRMNKEGDLPNAFGGRDVWGGKVDKGYAHVKLVGIQNDTLILSISDVSWTSTETTMDRYGAFRQPGTVDVAQTVNIGDGPGQDSTLVHLDTTRQNDIVIAGVRIKVIEVQPYSVRYLLEDLQTAR